MKKEKSSKENKEKEIVEEKQLLQPKIDVVFQSIKSVQAEVVNTIQIKVTANGEDSEEEGYGKSEIKEYRIYVNEETEPKAKTQTENYTFKDLIGGANYKFTVVAVDKAGNESDKQNEKAQVSQLAGKVVDINTSCVKYYADLDGVIENSASYEPDGVIYVDLAKGASGTWNPSGNSASDSLGTYSIDKVTSDLKEYFISKESFNGKFGNSPVISPVKMINGKKDRFYVMALKDSRESSVPWGKYGQDVWYVPSSAQWAAFANCFNISMTSYSTTFDLSKDYWSSSSVGERKLYCNFKLGMITSCDTANTSRNYLRFGTTF